MVVSVHPSVYLAGAGRAGRAGVVVSVRLSVLQGRGRAGHGAGWAGQEWWCLFVYLSCKARAGARHGAGAGQGSQTFSVTLRITDFLPRSRFGNFEKSAIRIWEFRSPPPPRCCADS
jgi:hypothetical protein